MPCARADRPCRVEADKAFTPDGKAYRCQKCARECFDPQCVCSADDTCR